MSGPIFSGEFTLDRPLSSEHAEYLRQFSRTRKITRNAGLTAKRPDPVRKAVGLPVGYKGSYFVSEPRIFTQPLALICTRCDKYVSNIGVLPGNRPVCPECGARMMNDVTDYNHPPGCSKGACDCYVADHEDAQPSLWCHWTPDEKNLAIVWDEGENFYRAKDWIKYLIKHFLAPWGYMLNGKVEFFEDFDTRGVIQIVNNSILLIPLVEKTLVGQSIHDEEEEGILELDPAGGNTDYILPHGENSFWVKIDEQVVIYVRRTFDKSGSACGVIVESFHPGGESDDSIATMYVQYARKRDAPEHMVERAGHSRGH